MCVQQEVGLKNFLRSTRFIISLSFNLSFIDKCTEVLSMHQGSQQFIPLYLPGQKGFLPDTQTTESSPSITSHCLRFRTELRVPQKSVPPSSLKVVRPHPNFHPFDKRRQSITSNLYRVDAVDVTGGIVSYLLIGVGPQVVLTFSQARQWHRHLVCSC